MFKVIVFSSLIVTIYCEITSEQITTRTAALCKHEITEKEEQAISCVFEKAQGVSVIKFFS